MKKFIYTSLLAVLLLAFCQKNANAQDNNTVYNFVSLQNPPTYPGGMASFYSFLGANIKYPTAAVKDKVEGKVYVSFTVEKDGSLTDLKVDRSLGAGTDEEAIRVLKMSKRWNPGMIEGKAVRVKYNIPIRFALNKGGKTSATIDANHNIAVATPKANDNTVYNFISLETPPKYPGGMEEFYHFLGSNIIYPPTAVENKVEGNVFVSFIVEKDGSVNDIKVERSLGSGTDEEAVRVLKLGKQWIPGSINGVAVRSKYNIPVKFSLTK